MDPEERKVIQATIPGPVVEICALPECVQDMAMGNLTGGRHMADARTMAPGQGARPKPARGKSPEGNSSAPRRSTASWVSPEAPRGP